MAISVILAMAKPVRVPLERRTPNAAAIANEIEILPLQPESSNPIVECGE